LPTIGSTAGGVALQPPLDIRACNDDMVGMPKFPENA
jgi:hypothetical protein